MVHWSSGCPEVYQFQAVLTDFPGGSAAKHPPVNAGDVSSIPDLERSPAEGNGNPLQYSCLGNLMDREAWRATVHRGAKERNTTQQLNNENIPIH